jgi:16S rRNA processing protein RimM
MSVAAANRVVASQSEMPFPDDAVEVGRVLGAWGVGGGIRIKPLAPNPQALFSAKRWFLDAPATRSPKHTAATPSLPKLLRVRSAREQGEIVVATVEDVADRDAAEALTGARIFVSRASFPTPATDEFYWVDLIGLAVLNRDGEALGSVVGLIETGPHCVLRVQPSGANASERLIPFVAAYVEDVDLSARKIRVDWDAGND